MASRDRPRRRFAVLRLAVLTGAVAVTALLDAPADTRAVRAVPVASTGAMSITSSHSGAILSASRLLPGDSVTGSVTITNSGEAPALVTLSQADLVDSPGHAGARLSAALLVEVEDVTSNRRVYFGPLATMPPVDLGRFAAGAARLIRFTATVPVVLPPGLMKTSTSVRYDWTATEADEDAAAPPATKANPEPDPTPPAPEPTAPAPPAPNPTAPAPSPLTLAVKAKARQPWKGPVVAYVTCGAPCKVGAAAKLTGAKGAGKLKANVPATQAPAGRRMTVKVKFTKRAKSALGRALRNKRSKPKVTIAVTATGVAGNKASRSVVVQLKRPRR